MKKCQAIIALCLSISLVLSGCAQTTANPVPVAQIGDETRGCQSLWQEIQQMPLQINAREVASGRQSAKNAVLGVTGIFFIVPWFFMDLGNAASVEKRAAQARLDRLHALYAEKGCQAKVEPKIAPKAR